MNRLARFNPLCFELLSRCILTEGDTLFILSQANANSEEELSHGDVCHVTHDNIFCIVYIFTASSKTLLASFLSAQ